VIYDPAAATRGDASDLGHSNYISWMTEKITFLKSIWSVGIIKINKNRVINMPFFIFHSVMNVLGNYDN
jgi:hypothetical protein